MTSNSAEASDKPEDIAKQLWTSWKADRTTATRNELFEHYLPWCRSMACTLFSKYHHYLVDWHDCVSVVSLATLKCIETFDSDRGTPFEAYAYSRVRGSVLNEIKSNVKQARQDHHHEARKTIAYEMNISSTDDSFSTIVDLAIEMAFAKLLDIGCMEGCQPDSHYEREQTAQAVARLVDELTSDEKLVIKGYYFQHLSLKEIAEVMNLSTARISQIHRSGLASLRDIYEKYH